MVSSENPFSNTSRYYNNPYEAKRDKPSIANEKKNWGEPQKDHYYRSGVESKNNPFS